MISKRNSEICESCKCLESILSLGDASSGGCKFGIEDKIQAGGGITHGDWEETRNRSKH